MTYNVVGNTNEFGLVITETTFGGLESGHQDGAILDYGSLIWVTLQRCKTAREAIQTMSHLMDTYGYASTGESFSLADRITGEVWIMEVISRGSSGKKGAAWVARRVPDGYIAGHSNQARITTFPRNDPDNCLYSEDVVDFAVSQGLWDPKKNKEEDFSFSDVYDKVTFEGARMCDARTWTVFSQVLDDGGTFLNRHATYAQGIDLQNRMPLWVKPKHKLTLQGMVHLLDNHYEGTVLSFHDDVGAGPYQAPYRSGPLKWYYNHLNKNCFINERPIAIQKTGFTLIAQIRMHMPFELSSILWFGVDDSATAPRFPVYGSSREVSHAFKGKGCQDGVPEPVLKFDLTKAFWIQNMVSNLAYSQWNSIYPKIHARKMNIIQQFQQEVHQKDAEALKLLDKNKENNHESMKNAMIQIVSEFSRMAGDRLHQEWTEFYGELFVAHRDFSNITPKEDNPLCNCEVTLSPYSTKWENRIIQDTGKHYSCHHQKKKQEMEPRNFIRIASDESDNSHRYKNKLDLKSLQ